MQQVNFSMSLCIQQTQPVGGVSLLDYLGLCPAGPVDSAMLHVLSSCFDFFYFPGFLKSNHFQSHTW